MSQEQPVLLLIRADWRGSETAAEATVFKDGVRLASGTPYHLAPDRGMITARTEIRSPGQVTILVINTGRTAGQIELVAGSLALSLSR